MRISMSRLMLVMAFAGISLRVAARTHIGLGIFVGTVSALALARTFGVIDRHRTDPRMTTNCKLDVLLNSVIAGTGILAASCCASLLVYGVLSNEEIQRASSLESVPLILAATAGAFVCRFARRFLWPYRLEQEFRELRDDAESLGGIDREIVSADAGTLARREGGESEVPVGVRSGRA